MKYRKLGNSAIGVSVIGPGILPMGTTFLVAFLQKIVDKRGVLVALVSINWEFAQPGLTPAMIGATTLNNMKAQIGILQTRN